MQLGMGTGTKPTVTGTRPGRCQLWGEGGIPEEGLPREVLAGIAAWTWRFGSVGEMNSPSWGCVR